jgi:uncharacterized DUF497 family protein
MRIAFDPVKRDETLRERGLDFADAGALFDGKTYTAPDVRFDYGEERLMPYGRIEGVAIVLLWVERADEMRSISMRRAHAKEMRNVGLD